VLDPAGDRLSAGAMATAMCRLVAAQYFVIVWTCAVVMWNANERLLNIGRGLLVDR
jgi:hypothetical protein